MSSALLRAKGESADAGSILVVNDANSGVGSTWYDTSSIMPLVKAD